MLSLCCGNPIKICILFVGVYFLKVIYEKAHSQFIAGEIFGEQNSTLKRRSLRSNFKNQNRSSFSILKQMSNSDFSAAIHQIKLFMIGHFNQS